MFNREKLNKIYKWWLAIDRTLYILILLLIIFGMIFVGTASPTIAKRLGLAPNFFIRKHFVFAALSIFLVSFISIFTVNQIKLIGVSGTITCIFLLIIVLMFGFAAKGAKRWLYIFGFSFQPTEILKPLFITANAYLLSVFYQKNALKKLAITVVPYLIIVLLILLQPDIGMIILISLLFAIQLFVAELPMFYFWIMGLAAGIFGTSAYIFLPHVTNRINGFLISLMSSNKAAYQVGKSLKAYSAGGFLGKGPLEGTIKNYIPDAHTDFIFAVIGEEFGLFFCIIILCLFFYVTFRVLLKAVHETNTFKFLTIFGLISQFILQAIINIGVTLNLLPTKGMTLPFISYGGSSMLGISICFGIILALTKDTYKKRIKVKEILLEKI